MRRERICDNASCTRAAVWSASFDFGDEWSPESDVATSRFCGYHAAEFVRDDDRELTSLTPLQETAPIDTTGGERRRAIAASGQSSFSISTPIAVSERAVLAGFDPHPDVTADLLPERTAMDGPTVAEVFQAFPDRPLFPRCATCKHWEGPSRGRCMLIDSEGPSCDRAWALGDHGYGASLFTAPDFGCILHAPTSPSDPGVPS